MLKIIGQTYYDITDKTIMSDVKVLTYIITSGSS